MKSFSKILEEEQIKEDYMAEFGDRVEKAVHSIQSKLESTLLPEFDKVSVSSNIDEAELETPDDIIITIKATQEPFSEKSLKELAQGDNRKREYEDWMNQAREIAREEGNAVGFVNVENYGENEITDKQLITRVSFFIG